MATKISAQCVSLFQLETTQGKRVGKTIALRTGQQKFPVDAPPGKYLATLVTKIQIQDPIYLKLLERYKSKKVARSQRKLIIPAPPSDGEFPYHQFDATRWSVVIEEDFSLRIASQGKVKTIKQELLNVPGSGSFDPSSIPIPGYSNDENKIDLGGGLKMVVGHKAGNSNDAVFLRSGGMLNGAKFFEQSVSVVLVPKKPRKQPKKKEEPKKARTKSMIYFVGPFITGDDDPWKLDKKAKGSRVGRPIQALLKDVESWPANTWARLKENQTPGGETIKITGFADPRDTEKANRSLSARRAENVMKALQKAIGGPTGNFNVRGAGEKGKKPDDPNWRVVQVEVKITL